MPSVRKAPTSTMTPQGQMAINYQERIEQSDWVALAERSAPDALFP